MSLPREKAWFPSKTYGYGWGLPKRWQGWVAMTVYLLTVAVAGIALVKDHPGGFVAFALGTTGVLIALCYWKGEAAKWRWGD